MPFAAGAGGVRVRVRLTPRGGADRIEGVGAAPDGRRWLVARVASAPEGGKANAALAALIAGAAGVAKGRVSVIAGTTQRVKTLLVEGDPAVLIPRLRDATEEQP